MSSDIDVKVEALLDGIKNQRDREWPNFIRYINAILEGESKETTNYVSRRIGAYDQERKDQSLANLKLYEDLKEKDAYIAQLEERLYTCATPGTRADVALAKGVTNVTRGTRSARRRPSARPSATVQDPYAGYALREAIND